ncbi:MAG: ABC-F family ATP-binding cassette domain-containing protein, partial [Clostridia bacterium]|nr:ABC-F family ATP-binding cassette domain-containing protein [Clostridia bacterium]
MALLTVKGLTKYFGEEELLHDVSFEVYENNRIGLIGSNGSGKTTLFRILLGLEPYDDGEVVRAKNAEIGYMEQHVCRDLEKTAFEEVLTVFSDLLALERQIEKTQSELQNASGELSALLERQMAEREEFLSKGGLTFRSRARSALLGLGFTENSIENRVGVLSGGQKAKLQLAKMLLSGA